MIVLPSPNLAAYWVSSAIELCLQLCTALLEQYGCDRVSRWTWTLTSSGVCGASTEPRRPMSEQAASAEERACVGYSSAVNTYSELNANVMASLPTKNSPSAVPS